jgi:hypothetical protein
MRSIWFGRIVLLAATAVLLRVGLAYVIDPVAAVVESRISLGSAGAATAMRVSGALFVAIALVLLACWSPRRLLSGLGVLTVVAVAVTTVRLVGLIVDGSDPFTLEVLRPEIALVVVSVAALAVERRRSAAARH